MAVQRSLERFNLRSRLRFNIDDGQIWLDESRMLLLHAKALGALRRELIDSLGAKRSHGLLFRMGFTAGQEDAERASKLLGAGENYDVFQIGPELHAFEGLVKSTITEAQIDWEQGTFFGEVVCENSWEAESHLQQYGIGEEAACWTLAGYASGYVTRFFRRFIVFRETQCTCCGDPHCVLVGKPVEAWGDDAYLEYCRPAEMDTAYQELAQELWQLRGRQREQMPSGKLVGGSPAFRTAFDLLSKAAHSPITVLLLGETGVGKEVFAQWLHENSDRANQPFVAVNCAAIPNDLIESELFGVQKGAFTGAQQSRPGRFERADGGTLFLDEIGDLSPISQIKLLRLLQEGEYLPLGSDKPKMSRARVVVATNHDLNAKLGEGSFRKDLFYRLQAHHAHLPPLRQRSGDIPLLLDHCLEQAAREMGRKKPTPPDELAVLLGTYHFPGNIRELMGMVYDALSMHQSGKLSMDGFKKAIGHGAGETVPRANDSAAPGQTPPHLVFSERLPTLEEAATLVVEEALRRSKNNQSIAAGLLGITRPALSKRLKKLREE